MLILFREWSDADFPKQRKHYAEKTVDFVSGMERREFTETTKTLCCRLDLVSVNPLHSIPETTNEQKPLRFGFGKSASLHSRNNEQVLFREIRFTPFPKQRNFGHHFFRLESSIFFGV